jgi:hypothetical protein
METQSSEGSRLRAIAFFVVLLLVVLGVFLWFKLTPQCHVESRNPDGSVSGYVCPGLPNPGGQTAGVPKISP